MTLLLTDCQLKKLRPLDLHNFTLQTWPFFGSPHLLHKYAPLFFLEPGVSNASCEPCEDNDDPDILSGCNESENDLSIIQIYVLINLILVDKIIKIK